jgi:hypothetical protein
MYTGRDVPLFNRVVVFVFSSAILAGLVVALSSPRFRSDLGLVTGLLLIVPVGIACFGIWISLKWRNRVPEELEAFPAVDRPSIPDDALVCRFWTGLKAVSIAVDSDAAVIHFENCHVPRRFLATAQTWYSCPIGDVRGVHRFGYSRGESLTIVTATGKAVIPAAATN